MEGCAQHNQGVVYLNIKVKIIIVFLIITGSIAFLSYQFINSDLFNLLEFEYFPPAVAANNISLSFIDEEKPFLRARNFKISLRTFQLIFGDIMLKTITAMEPVLDIDLERFRKKTRSSEESSDSSIENKITKFRNLFHIDYFTLRFRGLNILDGNLKLRNFIKGKTLSFNRVNVDFESSFFTKDQIFGSIGNIAYETTGSDDSGVIPLKFADNSFFLNDIKFNAGIGRKILKLYFVTMNVLSQPVTLSSGHIKNFLSTPEYKLDYFTSIDLKKLFSHLHIDGDYDGNATATGTLIVDSGNISLDGSLNTSPLKFNSLNTGSISSDYFIENDLLSIRDFNAKIETGSASGEATVKLKDNFPIEADIELNELCLEHILDYVGVSGAHVKLPLSGKSKFSGNLKSPFSLNFESKLIFDHLKVLNNSYNNPRAEQLFYLSAGRVTATHTVNSSAVTVHQALIELDDSASRAELKVTFPYTNSMTIIGKIINLNLKQLKLLDFSMAGNLNGKLSMDGKFNCLSLSVPFTATGGRFNGIPFSHLSGNAGWFSHDITFNDLKLAHRDNFFTGDILVNLKDKTALSINVAAKKFDVETLPEYPLPSKIKSRVKNLQGKVSGKFFYENEPAEKGRLEFKGERISFHDITAAGIFFSGELNNDTYNVKNFRLFRDASKINIRAKLTEPGQLISGSIIGDVYSNNFPEIKKKFGLSNIYLDLFSEFSGTLSKPEINLKIRSSPFSIFDEKIEGSSVINMSTGKEFLAHGDLFEKRLSFVVSENNNLFNLTFNFRDYNLGKMLDMYLNPSIGRPLDLDFLLTAKGELSFTSPFSKKPFSGPRGDIKIKKIYLSTESDRLTNKTPYDIEFKNGTFRSPEINLTASKPENNDHLSFSLSHISGEFSCSGKGILPVNILQPLFERKNITLSGGKFDFNWGFIRFKKISRLLASISLNNSTASLYNSSIPLSAVEGDIKISNDRISIDHLRGKFGIGNFDIDGNIILEKNPELNLDLLVKNGQINYKNKMKATLDGNINILGEKKPYTLTGSIFFPNLSYTGNIDWKTMLVRRKVSKFLPGDSEASNPLFNFNLYLQGKENIYLKNNLADIEFKTDLLLHGTSNNPLFRGDLDAISGYFYYQRNIFEINSFHVAFSDSVKINPYYNVVARTEIDNIPNPDSRQIQKNVENYLITLTTSGQLSDISRNIVTITSSPPLPKSDLAELLTFRTITPDESQAENIGEAAALDILSGQLQEALERETRKVVEGLSIKVEPRYSEDSQSTTPAVTLRKKLTDRLSMRGTKVLNDNETGDQEYKLELKITPNLSISSGFEESEDEDNLSETIDFEVQLPFGR